MKSLFISFFYLLLLSTAYNYSSDEKPSIPKSTSHSSVSSDGWVHIGNEEEDEDSAIAAEKIKVASKTSSPTTTPVQDPLEQTSKNKEPKYATAAGGGCSIINPLNINQQQPQGLSPIVAAITAGGKLPAHQHKQLYIHRLASDESSSEKESDSSDEESNGSLSEDEQNFEEQNPGIAAFIKKKEVKEQMPNLCSEFANCFGPCFPWWSEQPKKKHEKEE